MTSQLERLPYFKDSTIGNFVIINPPDAGILFNCITCEDTVRADGIKIKDDTAIPEGEYKIAITWSNRFQRFMPLIFNQDDLTVRSHGVLFSGIRIHPGNTEFDTSACLLVGLKHTDGVIDGGTSKPAFDKLYPILLAEIGEWVYTKKTIPLTIINLPQAQ